MGWISVALEWAKMARTFKSFADASSSPQINFGRSTLRSNPAALPEFEEFSKRCQLVPRTCDRRAEVIKNMLSSCPFCHVNLPSTELEWHANNHFADDELERDMKLAMQIALAPPSPEVMDKPTNCQDPSASHSGRSVGPCNSDFDHDGLNSRDVSDQVISLLIGLQTKSSLYIVEGGLMTLLRKCLELENGNSISIISQHINHYQTIESEDIGWGCGWRNIQMLSSHLLACRPDATDVMFGGSGFVPDILSLQRWLEIAWKRGFDTHGSNSFNQKVYGLRKWIGTTECATIFRSFGLRARIVDFDSVDSKKRLNNGTSKHKMVAQQIYGPMDKFLQRRKNENLQDPSCGKYPKEKSYEPQGRNVKKICGPEVLVDWVWKYFACKFISRLGNSKSVLVSEKTPLYFQHAGHSRTIVGIQMQKGRCASEHHYSLLVLDPGHRTAALERSLIDNSSWQRFIKRGVHTLKKPQYQLCYVDPGIAYGEEMEQLKFIDSVLVEL